MLAEEMSGKARAARRVRGRGDGEEQGRRGMVEPVGNWTEGPRERGLR